MANICSQRGSLIPFIIAFLMMTSSTIHNMQDSLRTRKRHKIGYSNRRGHRFSTSMMAWKLI